MTRSIHEHVATKITRRTAMKTSAGLAMGAALAGHFPAAAQDTASNITIPDPVVELPTEDITFRWVDSGGLKQFFFNAFFPVYEEAHPNIAVDYQVLPWPKIGEVVPLGVRAGNAQDVFQVPQNVSGAQAVREGWVQPIQDLIPDFESFRARFPSNVFLPGITDFDGKTYAFPLWSTERYGTLTLFNRAYMQEAGYDPEETPLTWDTFRDAAKKITEQGGGEYFGLIIGGSQTGRWSDAVGNLARMAGASAGTGAGKGSDHIDWRTGEYVFTSDEYLAAIDLLLAMNDDGSFFPGSLSLNAQQARSQFPQGVAGIILQGPWNIPEWESANPDFDFGVASQPVPNEGDPLPLTVGPGSGDLFWVFAESPYGAVAADIFSYVGSLDGQKALLELSGGSSPVLFPEANESAENVGPRAKTSLDIFAEQVRLGPDPHVRNPDLEAFDIEYQAITPDFGATVQGIFIGQLSDPKAAMQDLQDRSNAELERAIKAAQDNGASVSRDDWVFPNWDPTKDYTQADYDAL